MRKISVNIDEVKKYVDSLVGEKVSVRVNKGRKRIVKYNGRVENVYPSVFVLSIFDCENVTKLSCSYSDVLCGDILLARAQES